MLLGGFVCEGLATLAAGLMSAPVAAGVLLGLSWLMIAGFNVVAGSLRQELVPDHLLGRVIGTFRLIGYGTVSIGALLGGVLVPLAALAARPAVNARTIALARAERP